MGGKDNRGTFLVEHYWPGVTEDMFRVAADRMRVAAGGLAVDGNEIAFLHSTLVPEDEAAFCVFEASSPGLVLETYGRAGVRFERILDALEIGQSTALPAAVPTIREET
jgi:Nickel responsive protein SCO4226-like